MQNAMVPLNLATQMAMQIMLIGGHWAKRSIKEAQRYTNVIIAVSSEEEFEIFPKQES